MMISFSGFSGEVLDSVLDPTVRPYFVKCVEKILLQVLCYAPVGALLLMS